MKQIIILAAIFVALAIGCKTKTVYVPVERVTTETVTVKDTIVETKLELIRDSVSVPDSMSYLANKYAYSWAEIKEGRLNHSLSMLPVLIPVEIQYIERHRIDSIPAPYPVEVIKKVEKELSWWQSARIRIGEISLVLLIIGLGYLGFRFLKQ
ncbi:hypothetical protein M2459_001330 [Parabacteroides sp. PF5-5]|uniref:hypothetical protein n=1 Tax=unclassified Parabacteroides TaxID=2649774 RepID=UPI002473CEC2|nr:MULTISPECIES: hypothetical protein [unclassified Parabacteroides]MDH6304595.1 hypothetical protein [Parabacteroides sp. PH5-39]MDH6315792.1 hypothetical protein [Parabacteroides sp. PF5-13]MDH6319451.1 hypothetical protein [Parabacteroides sp. PH5-13]MDH6323182.1 hypothetical protein [Parabacteroides sp. PH5-8]MDH6326984.1 hypothetical protein [Parabacteroides sp. PH5-41]